MLNAAGVVASSRVQKGRRRRRQYGTAAGLGLAPRHTHRMCAAGTRVEQAVCSPAWCAEATRRLRVKFFMKAMPAAKAMGGGRQSVAAGQAKAAAAVGQGGRCMRRHVMDCACAAMRGRSLYMPRLQRVIGIGWRRERRGREERALGGGSAAGSGPGRTLPDPQPTAQPFCIPLPSPPGEPPVSTASSSTAVAGAGAAGSART